MFRVLLIATLAAATGVAHADAPEPELRPGREPRPRDSVWQLSADVPLAAIETLARQRIPANQRWRAPAYTHPVNGGAGSIDGISIGYDIVAGDASVRAGGRGEIVTVIPLTYSIWARYQPVPRGPSFDASCQKRSASLVLTTQIAVRRSKLAPRTRASVAARSRCVITRLQIDVTDLLTGLVGSRLRRVTAEIDREVGSTLELGGAAALAWRRLLSPQKLDGGWLDINPLGLQIPPLARGGQGLIATVQVIARSSLTLGDRRPAARSTTLPSIDSHSSPGQLSVLVDVSVTDASLDRWATRAAKKLKLPARITGAALRPRGRLAAVGVDVAGVGRVWATGALGADPSTGALVITGLKLTTASRALLGRSRLTPAALVDGLGKAFAAVALPELAGLRPRVQDALTASLTSAVPLLSGAAAIERIKLASAVRTRRGRRLYFRAEGTSSGARSCAIRARGKIKRRELLCTRQIARAHCAGDRRCQYSTDGSTWLPVY